MTYNWESGAIFELIDMYRERPTLWDVDRDVYRDRSKKSAAWQEIAMHFGVDKLVVERKMKILISQYRRELQRGLKGEVSKWYAFTRLSFLKTGNSANSSSSGALAQNQTESEEEKSEDEDLCLEKQSRIKRYKASSPVSASSPQIMPSASHIGVIRQRPPSIEFVAPKITRKRLPSSESNPEVSRTRCISHGTNKIIKMLNRDRKSRDEFAVFGEHIANKLRNLNNSRARNTVQYHINNILYNADMGKYDGDTPKQKRRKDGREESAVKDLTSESSDDSSGVLKVQFKKEPTPSPPSP